MKNTLSKEELLDLYNNKPVREICQDKNMSVTALYALLDQAKIPRKKTRTKRTKWTLEG